jgi:hypothetical protein
MITSVEFHCKVAFENGIVQIYYLLNKKQNTSNLLLFVVCFKFEKRISFYKSWKFHIVKQKIINYTWYSNVIDFCLIFLIAKHK